MSELNQEQDLLVNEAKQVQANNCYAASVAQSTGAQESLLLHGADDESLIKTSHVSKLIMKAPHGT